MTFTTTVNSACAGGNHIHMTVVIGGVSYPLTCTPADMQVDFSTQEEAREAIVARLRSRVKEQNASTFAQIKTAIEGQTYKL